MRNNSTSLETIAVVGLMVVLQGCASVDETQTRQSLPSPRPITRVSPPPTVQPTQKENVGTMSVMGKLVSITDKAVTVNNNVEDMTFTITQETKFFDGDGKEVKRDTLSLKAGDIIAVTAEGTKALGIKQGGTVSLHF